MTIQEKLDAIMGVQPYQAEIADKIEEIIKDTYDGQCYCVDSFVIGYKHISVDYLYSCRGESDRDYATIPREWLDDGFDYRTAYEEEKRKAEDERRRMEAEKKRNEEKKRKAEAARKSKEEYEQYLHLKAKYEGGAE